MRLLDFACYILQGLIESKSGFHRDDHHVERVRQGETEFRLALFDLLFENHARRVIAQPCPRHQEYDAQDGILGDMPMNRQREKEHDDTEDHLDPEEDSNGAIRAEAGHYQLAFGYRLVARAEWDL